MLIIHEVSLRPSMRLKRNRGPGVGGLPSPCGLAGGGPCAPGGQGPCAWLSCGLSVTPLGLAPMGSPRSLAEGSLWEARLRDV